MRLQVTGFGVFDATSDNPSAHLARAIDPDAVVLDVAFDAADEFLKNLDPESFDGLLMLGFSAKARKLTIEQKGRNVIGTHADVSGVVRTGEITKGGPATLDATLWANFILWKPNLVWHVSQDAGSYLCNYILYRALETFPTKKVGFIHVPSFDAVSEAKQVNGLEQLLARCAPGRQKPGVRR